MKLMEGEHVGPFNLGNPGEFTMLELAQVSSLLPRTSSAKPNLVLMLECLNLFCFEPIVLIPCDDVTM